MKRSLLLLFLGMTCFAATAQADDDDDNRFYEVTVTNVTRGQTFTPILVATHRPGVSLFAAGQPASAELAALAEGGDTAPLAAKLGAMPEVKDIATSAGLLGPGASVTVRVRTEGGFRNISLASMLIPTNDAFFALNDVRGPKGKRVMELESPAYDAGSEPNDELCFNIPGPVCGGEGGSPNAGGEGYVHIHAGMHGIGSLVAADRDWRNPVAKISIRRVR